MIASYTNDDAEKFFPQLKRGFYFSAQSSICSTQSIVIDPCQVLLYNSRLFLPRFCPQNILFLKTHRAEGKVEQNLWCSTRQILTKILSISIGCNNRIILRIAQVIEEVGVYCSNVYFCKCIFCEVHLISLAIASFFFFGGGSNLVQVIWGTGKNF